MQPLIVTGYDFIFSRQRKHRIARHVVFWLVWCVAFNLLFHFPTHVYKGWDVSGPGTKNLQHLGLPLFFIKALIVNSFLAVIVPQMALVYVLIYWLIPNYFYQRKNYLLTSFLTLCLLAGYYWIAVGFKYTPTIYNNIVNITPSVPTLAEIHRFVITDQLISLPIIVGFALMITLVKRWWQKQKETEQLSKEKTKAELQLLKDQVHPHFLFNTINNIYFFTLINLSQAADMIKKLAGLLNYILNDCNQPLVTLEKEIQMIQDYVALEKIRYGEDKQLTIAITGQYQNKLIHPLLLIPFVENSFKHGASKVIGQPYVKLNIHIENNRLHFVVTNNKPATKDLTVAKGNIGLKNVRKRLELLYPDNHQLDIVTEQHSYTVNLSLPLQDINGKNITTDLSKLKSEYAMA
jgi:sensor histidine kinase YesM